MEDEETTESLPVIRPDWWVPASIGLRMAGEVLTVVGTRIIHLANVFVGYSNYEDDRIEFHNAAAAELEKIIEEEPNG